jgi:hypothetical protein
MERVRLLREFSLNQFTFRTYEQYRSWEREWKRLLDATGQSYEAFFLTDGKVDVRAMVKEIDIRIRRGDKAWFSGRGLAKYLEKVSDGSKNHTKIKTLRTMQDIYGEIYGYAVRPDDDASESGQEDED